MGTNSFSNRNVARSVIAYVRTEYMAVWTETEILKSTWNYRHTYNIIIIVIIFHVSLDFTKILRMTSTTIS